MRLAAAAVSALLVLVGCGGGSSTDSRSPTTGVSTEGVPSPVSIDIETFAYMPADVSVPIGTTITWTNRDDFAHTVTSGRARDTRDDFAEGVLGDLGEMNAQGTTFSWIVDTPGTFLYFCRFHPNMQGSITVAGG